MTNDDDIANAARTCTDVSIVVNNAGILRQSASLADGGIEAARAEMETNYFGSMRMARAFAPILRDNGGGALVNVLSVLSFISMPQGATYSASKSAAWSLTNALRIELRRQGTLVVAVHAGFIDTDMAAGVSGEKVSPESVAKQIVTARRKRRRGGPRRCDQRDGESGIAERSHRAVSGAPGPVGHRNGGTVMNAQREPVRPTSSQRRTRTPRPASSRPGAWISPTASSARKTGTPVIFLTHLAANLDNWDPRVVDGIAAQHHVITFDNRGVGASSGKVPDTVEAMAHDAVTFIRALGFEQVDILGFSLGGMIAQVIALEEPQLIRKLILTGTGPAGGEGIDKVTRISNLDVARAAAQLPGSEDVPVLHQDRQRQTISQRVPGTVEGAHRRTATRRCPCPAIAPS